MAMLAWLALAAGAAEIELPVVGRFVEGEYADDGTAEGWVDRGSRDGVITESVGVRVYRTMDDGSVVTVGTADVLEVRRRRTRVRLHVAEGVTPTIGDAVRLPASFDAGERPLAWDLAREGVDLRVGKRSLTDWSRVRRDPFALSDEALCEAIAADARLTDVSSWNLDALGGRFEGRPFADVIAGAEASQACNAARFALDASEAVSKRWAARDLYVAWVASGGPLSIRELRDDGLELSDAAFADLVRVHATDDGYWSDRVYIELVTAALAGEAEEARHWQRLLERWAAYDPAAVFDAVMAPGELAFAAGDGEGAIAAWTEAFPAAPEDDRAWAYGKLGRAYRLANRNEEAIAAFEQGIALGSIGVRGWEDYGDTLVDLGRWPEAEGAYRRCLDGWAGVVRAEQPVRVAWCSMGLGRALREQGRYSDAWDAWATAWDVAAARGWNVYELRAQEGLADVAWDWGVYGEAGELYDLVARGRLDLDDPARAALAWQDASLAWWEAGRPDLAFDRADRALDLLREHGDGETIGHGLHQIATFEKELGDAAAALSMYQEALGHFRRDDLTNRSRTLQYMARIRMTQGRTAEAAALLDEAITAARDGGDGRQEAFALDLRADLTRRIEDRQAAVEAWRTHGDELLLAGALVGLARSQMGELPADAIRVWLGEADAIAARSDDRGLQARVLVARGHLAALEGDPEQAEALGAQAAALTEGFWGTPYDWLEIARLRTPVAVERGRPDEALALADALLADLAARPSAASVRDDAVLLRADALLASARYAEAYDAAREARSLAMASGDAATEAFALERLASVAALEGRYELARDHRERARMLLGRAGLGGAGLDGLSRAATAASLGRSEEALTLATAALDGLGSSGPGMRSAAHRVIALAHALDGDLDAALASARTAAAVPGITPVERVHVALLTGWLHVARGEWSEALAALEAVGDGEGLPAYVLEAETWRAIALAELGRAEEAAGHARVAELIAAKADIALLTLHARHATGRVALARGDAASAVQALSEAADLLDRTHAGLDADGAVVLRRSPHGALLEDLARAQEALGRPDAAAAARARREAAPDVPPTLAAATFTETTDALEASVPDLLDRIAVPTTSFAALQADLRPNEALVVPAVLPGRVVVFVVRATGEPAWIEVPVEEDHVAELVADMRAALQSPGVAWSTTRAVKVVQARPAADPTLPAKELHRLLIAPVLPLLEGADTLIVAPGGRLRYVPFAALTDGERFLVEDYRLALLTASGSTTVHRPVDPKEGVLALSNPDGSLPGATAEVLAIRKAWGRRAVVHDGPAATEEALRTGLAGVGILHLATHGVLDDAQPRDSYLLMAGEEARLTLGEIALLPLDGVDLVVLSACETAVGEHGEGREIAGLAYQFEVRGAASVVASLWPVDDTSTSAMMVELYGELRRKRTRADALREAQLALLADPETAHPYFWAPFLLIGDWR